MKKYKLMLLGAIGATVGIILLQVIASNTDIALLVAPFGATFVLIFALPDSPLSKPRNIAGAYLISTSISLVVYEILGDNFLFLGLAFGISFILMQLTKTLHPPVGAIPIIIMLSPPDWLFVLSPILVGVLIILVYERFYRFISSKINF